jgi:hypothetical protein
MVMQINGTYKLHKEKRGLENIFFPRFIHQKCIINF